MADQEPTTSEDKPFELAPPLSKKEERRAKINARIRDRFANEPGYREKVLAYYSTPEQKAKRNARNKVYYSTPERKAKQREHQQRYLSDPVKKARAKALEKARYATPEGRVRRNGYTRKSVYGLTHEEFADMVAACKGRCPCCKVAFSEMLGTQACVDHDHAKGKGRNSVRGIVCKRCNSVLGFAGDSPDILRACARYLERIKKQDFQA